MGADVQGCGEQTGGSFTTLETVIPPGQGPPLHTHANEDEAWYVIEGELRFKLGGDVSHALSGSFVFVPRGTPHCFQNVDDSPARILVMFTPAGMGRFFDRFAALPEPDPEAFATIGRQLGMEVVGPPLAQPDPLPPPSLSPCYTGALPERAGPAWFPRRETCRPVLGPCD